MKELTYNTAPKVVRDVFWIIDENYSISVDDSASFLKSYETIRNALMVAKAEPEALMLLDWMKNHIESLNMTNNGYFKVGFKNVDATSFLRDTLPDGLQPDFKKFLME